jgi:hypothetical protein
MALTERVAAAVPATEPPAVLEEPERKVSMAAMVQVQEPSIIVLAAAGEVLHRPVRRAFHSRVGMVETEFK